jgi:SNF2 family DNA or RNA helicase
MADVIARIPGLSAERGSDDWVGRVTPALMYAIATDLAPIEGFEASQEILETMWQMKHQRNEIDEGKRTAPGYDDRLYGYQHAGVHMLLRGGCLLGDEMGTGKTVMALTAARQAGGAVLVVAPNSMKHRWAREAAVWYPEAVTYVLEGTAKQKQNIMDLAAEDWQQGLPVIVTVNWESIRTLSRLAPYGSTKRTDKEQEAGMLNDCISWNVVIADEAHRAKDPKSKQTRALWALGHNVRHCWALTGTPVLNTPGDLWSIGRFYDPPTYTTSRHKWHNRYVDYIETQWGPKDIGLRKDRRDEFNAWFDQTFIRRTKDEVLDLPELQYQTRELDLTSKQHAAYNRMVSDMIVAVEGGVLLATDPLALLTRLSQIASATPVVDELDVVGLSLPSNKVAALLEILDEMDEGRQVAVFAQSRKLIELAEGELNRKGISNVSITGRVTAGQRDANVTSFQDGGARVALCTLGAGSEGINLYAADTAVFLQRSYAFGQNQQAESRIHRNGQTADKVTIIDLVSKDTLDEDVISALLFKGEMSEQVLRDQARQLLERKHS